MSDTEPTDESIEETCSPTAKHIAALERELTQANGKLARLKGFGCFAHLLARHGVVDPLAVQDPEGYDRGATLSRISKAHEEIWASFAIDAARKEPTP